MKPALGTYLPSQAKTNATITKTWSTPWANMVEISHEWTIRKFSLGWDELESSDFCAEGHEEMKWCLRLYPFGKSSDERGWVSVYLVRTGNRCGAYHRLRVSLLTAGGEKTNTKELTWGISPSREAGFSKFVERSRLVTDKLLPGDTFGLVCDLTMTVERVRQRRPGSEECFKAPRCSLLDDLEQLFECRKVSDVVLSSGGKELHAHKCILVARSPVFAAMFENETEEKKSNRVEITDLPYEVLLEMLRYMYTGKVPDKDQLTGKLLAAADKYNLERLKVLCEEALCSSLSIELAAEVLVLADRHVANQLKAHAIDYIRWHAADVLQTSGWKSMAKQQPKLVAEVMKSASTPLCCTIP